MAAQKYGPPERSARHQPGVVEVRRGADPLPLVGCADTISAMPSATPKKVKKETMSQPTLTTPGPPVVNPYSTISY